MISPPGTSPVRELGYALALQHAVLHGEFGPAEPLWQELL